ncbi:hypothetical protein J4403_04675 [Candidatus Woesearchaeota archaeon]|nr:hypothetical protein [Candidatus Woesearchaeota archaeon]
MDKELVWKDETGTYKMGYSQKLMKEQVRWQKINFAGNIALMALILILLLIVLFVLYKLDSVNFFMNLIQ